MITSYVSVQMRGPQDLTGDAHRKAQDALKSAIAKLPRNGDSLKLRFDDPRLPLHIEAVRDIIKRELGTIRFVSLTEEMVDTPDAPAEWYEIHPEAEYEPDGATEEGVPIVRADKMPKDAHVSEYFTPLMVSEKFKKFVESKKLRGLKFLHLPDKGKTRAPQWYIADAVKPLGRGLHARALDPKKIYDNWKVSHAWRYGLTHVTDEQWDTKRLPQSTGNAEIDRLIPLRKLGMGAVRRYLRQFVPADVDFAFTWRGEDQFQGGIRLCKTSRNVCVSRRIAQMLMKAKLLSAGELVPLEIVDAPPKGVVPLDEPGDTGPGPLLAGEWLQRVEQRERGMSGKTKPKLKAAKAPTLADVLEKIKVAQEGDRKLFPAGAGKAALDDAAARTPIPDAWRAVLATSDGFTTPASDALDEACASFEPAKSLAKAQKELAKVYRMLFDKPPKDLLLIGDTQYGDLLLLKISGKKSVDAQAQLFSMEENRVTKKWPNVAAMLTDLLGND